MKKSHNLNVNATFDSLKCSFYLICISLLSHCDHGVRACPRVCVCKGESEIL